MDLKQYLRSGRNSLPHANRPNIGITTWSLAAKQSQRLLPARSVSEDPCSTFRGGAAVIEDRH